MSVPSVGLVAAAGADIVAAALKSAGIVNPTRRQRRVAAKFYRKQLKARVTA